jgi:hypothetical protein
MYTVPFHSIRMSRVTAVKIYENFRTCHGSPEGCSNIQNKSQNRREMLKKSKFSRAHSAYSSKRRGDRTKCSFDLEDVREATHCGGGGGIGAKNN